MQTFRFPTAQFRAIQSPTGDSRVGLFYVQADGVPPDLFKWRDVNPREIKRGTAVYQGMVQTLSDNPLRFHERNRGVTLIAKDLTYDDKRKEVVLHMDDLKLHGVVDGAHTLDVILEHQKAEDRNGESKAHVFFKVFTGVDPDQIAEIAGGLTDNDQLQLGVQFRF